MTDPTQNPFVVVRIRAASLTGHDFAVEDTRTGERIGDNLSRRLAAEIAAEEWANERGET